MLQVLMGEFGRILQARVSSSTHYCAISQVGVDDGLEGAIKDQATSHVAYAFPVLVLGHGRCASCFQADGAAKND